MGFFIFVFLLHERIYKRKPTVDNINTLSIFNDYISTIIMSTKKEFIYQKGDPFEYDPSDNWDNEDINTLGAKMLFEGVSTEMCEGEDGIQVNSIVLSNTQRKIFNYDVVESLKSTCYIRTVTIKPGVYSEIWDEPNLAELESFIVLLKDALVMLRDVYDDAGYKHDIREHIVHQYYRQKRRDLQIKSIINKE